MTTMTNEPRKRGRPKGTSVYLKRDRETLSRFADREVATTGLALAAFLRSEGYKESALRRVQKRWRKDSDIYLREAQLRQDAGEPPSLIKTAFEFFAYVKNLNEAAEAAMAPLAASFERQVARHKRLAGGKQNGIVPMFKSETEAKASIRRFEQHMNHHSLPEEERGYSELTQAERLYRMSFLFFNVSMQLSQKDAGDEPND